MSGIWYGDHRGSRVLRHKEYPDDETVLELVVWKVPIDEDHPHGWKYRLHYGTLSGECLVRYDNRRGKGDHRHFGPDENEYNFIDLVQLINDFFNDIQHEREQRKWLSENQDES